MGNLSDTAKDILPEFQKFLLEKKLVPNKKAPFYAHWVSRFLNYARDQELSATEYHKPAVMEFLNILLQNGINIRESQELLGHKNVETTIIYIHVLHNMSNAPQSPLDALYGNGQ